MHVFDAVLFEDLDAGIIHDNVEPLSGTSFFSDLLDRGCYGVLLHHILRHELDARPLEE